MRAYDPERMLDEELMLVHKAVEIEMVEIQSSRDKIHSFKDIKKILEQ